jgi:hypothetical protein
VVLLDDPFGELCAAAEPWPTGAEGPGRRSLTAAMAELIPVLRSLAPAVVVTADDTDTLTGWCDRLFTLTRGRLAEQPTHSAAARRGRSAADRRGTPGPQNARQPQGALGPQTGDAATRRRPARLTLPTLTLPQVALPQPALPELARARRPPAGSASGV